MVVNVHAGHNPHGMVGCGVVGLVSESQENRKVKDYLLDELESRGCTVYDCTVNNGKSASDVLAKIVSKCNSHDVDLDVSIHFNASAKHDGNGVEAWIYSENSASKEYAENICREIAALGYKNRGVKVNPKFYVLKKTKAPAIIVECCFCDNEKDIVLYDASAIASAIATGITGIEETITVAPEEETISTDEMDINQPGDLTKYYRVSIVTQQGAFHNLKNALDLQSELAAKGYKTILEG